MSDEKETGIAAGLLRALGTMLGLHIQFAQREVANDLGRLLTGVVLLAIGGVLAVFGLLWAELALVDYLTTHLGHLRAVLAVAGGDLLIGLMLLMRGRARLRKPILKETRALVRRTVASFAE
jgi:hypothetical protein